MKHYRVRFYLPTRNGPKEADGPMTVSTMEQVKECERVWDEETNQEGFIDYEEFD